MKTCSDCLYYEVCQNRYSWLDQEDNTKYITCEKFKNKADFVEVVRCKDCKHSRPIDRNKSPEKYFRDDCIVCTCEDVVGDEYMIYRTTHFCSYGERKDT